MTSLRLNGLYPSSRFFRRKSILSLSIAFLTATASLFPYTKKAEAQAQILAPVLCATGIGCAVIGVVTIGGIAYYLLQNTQTGTFYHKPLYQARPKKPKAVPGQMDIFGGVVTTHEECRKMGGKRWQGDSTLGTKDGKNLGRCYQE